MIETHPDYDSLSRAAADHVVRIAQTAVTNNGRFLMALNGGGTPEGLFRLLAAPPHAAQLPWAQTHVFWSDERLVPPDADGSNYRQAHDLLLRHVPIPPHNVHRAQGELSPDDAVDDYKKQLQAVAAGTDLPRFDLILLGLGSDGHTASLFPGARAALQNSDPVTAVTADYDGRPAHRITFTPRLINRARHVIFLVSGNEKAAAVQAVLHGPHNPQQWPAQAIAPTHGEAHWLLDAAAASSL